MKIIMTLLVRNEEDILKQNLDYHLNNSIDYVIATDNLSVDGTKDILKEYEKKGVLKYLYEDQDTIDQDLWVTKMAQMANSDFNADWVINNDADEFWVSKSGSIRNDLMNIDEHINALHVKRFNFVCTQNQNNCFYSDMIYKQTPSYNSLGSLLPGKCFHRASSEVFVKAGNHDVDIPNKVEMDYNGITVYHYPLRSKSQFESKIRLGGGAHQRGTRNRKGYGTWTVLYKSLLEKGNLDSFFYENIFTEEMVSEGLKNGTLTLDTTLKEYFSELYLEHNEIITK